MPESTLCLASTVLATPVVIIPPGETVHFAGAVLVTLVVSILLCRHRIAQKKQLFFVTALASAVTANVLFSLAGFLCGLFYEWGWQIFTGEAWKWNVGLKNGLATTMSWTWLFTGISTFICSFPALGVAYYYERRSKNNETHVA